MNLSLLDPFVLAQDCPEVHTGHLHSGYANIIRFNRRGDLLAAGRSDGAVVIFDTETNGIARKLVGHTQGVWSLSWSETGQYLLSGSRGDWKCILWDLSNGSRVYTVRFEAPVLNADLHPSNHLIFVVGVFKEDPVVVDATSGTPKKTTLSLASKQSETNGTSSKPSAVQSTSYVTFMPSGNHVITGTDKGSINVFDWRTRQMVYSARLCTKMVTHIQLTPTGRDMLLNSSDGIVRTINLPDMETEGFDFDTLNLQVEYKFQDVVNRLSWNHVTFSASGEFVAASTFMHHDVYVWERRHGSLVRILEGPKEELSAVEWHPRRPLIAASGAEHGYVYFWSVVAPQKWSALAPDFVEVEENVDYEEHEDEFDIQPIEELHKRRLDREDEDVDVLTIEPTKGEIEDNGFKMPVLLDVDNSDSEDEYIAIGAGQYRRRSVDNDTQWLNDGEVAVSGDENGSGRRGTPTGTKAPASTKRRRND